MGFSYNVNVLNQKGSPAIYTDTFANRPPFGFAGRLFVANDTSAIYEDTGTAWVLIANVSSGAGTLQQVTTNGNTSNVGISVTAGGLSTNALTVTSLTTGSVPFVGSAGLITQDNPNLFWDDTNNRLGINTNTPTNNLDIHGSGTIPLLALNNTAGNQSFIGFVNNSVAKWRIGNSSTNTFDILNVGLAQNSLTISDSNNCVTFNKNIKLKHSASFFFEPGFNSFGGDSGGFYFFLGTNPFGAYFNFFNLTAQRTFTFPDLAGTIALTSNLNAYLPLTGGNMSGTLIINTDTAGIFLNRTAVTTYNGISYLTAGIEQWFVGLRENLSSNNYVIFNGTGTDALTISKATSNVLIGTSVDDTTNKLQVNGNTRISGLAGTGSRAVLADASGNLSAPVSDISVKKNIEPLKYGLETILKLNAVQFEFIEAYKNYGEGLQIGAIAQEVEKIIPEAVFTTPSTGLKGIDYNQFHGVYIKAIQDLNNIIDGLLKRIELLEKK
jgi:hypothetical protein